MFSLNEEELSELSNEVKSLQEQLENISKFASKVRSRSKITNPIQTEDKNTFESNIDLILAIQNTKHFKETVIQYFLNHLFKKNISFTDILNSTKSNAKLYSKQKREIKMFAALITQIIIKNYDSSFPYSIGEIIISYITIDSEIKQCKSLLKINDEVELLFSKMRQNKDFSNLLYNMFIRVDRKLFVPEHEKEECNSYDRPISLNYGVSLSAPHIHVHALKQFEYLLSIKNDGQSCVKFLDVGCGSGYVCTLMAVGFVLNNTNESYFKSYGCVYNEKLLDMAIIARNILGLNSFLELKHATIDMNDIGWTDNGPYDGIYCGAAMKETDAILLREQLKIDGYLMCVVEHPDSAAKQVMKLIKRIKFTEEKNNEKNDNNANNDEKNDKNDDLPDDFDGLKQLPTKKLNEYLRSKQIDPKSSQYNCIEKNDIINLILKIQSDIKNIEETKMNDENENENENDNFEVTELFDVRFRTLRGRFKYLQNNEESLITDSDSDDSSSD